MAIIVDADFPGGGVSDVHIYSACGREADWIIHFSAPLDGALLGESLWFCFRIRGAAGKKLRFIQQEMNHTLGPFSQATYAVTGPVIREGTEGEYKRIPKENTLFIPDPICFTFSVMPQSDETYIAFCHPYQYADLLRFIKKYPQELMLKYIGKTAEGRSYPVLIAGDNGDSRKKIIFASARQHSGETPASFVLEGFIDAYFGIDKAACRLREETVLLALPLVNLDGVEMGRYGKNAPPEDFNLAWAAKTCRMEIRSFLDLLETLLKTYKPCFHVDFHAPQPGGYSYVVPPPAGIIGKEGWRRINLLIDLFEELTHEQGRCRREDLDSGYISWGGDEYRSRSDCILIENYDFDSLILETAYHEDCFGNTLNPPDWHFMGRQFYEAFRRVWFEGYDNPSVRVDTKELFWEGWEMTASPRNVKINAVPGEFCAESEENGAVFFSDSGQINKNEEGEYIISCKGNAELVVFVYYNAEGKIAGKSRTYTMRLEDEKTVLPFSFFTKAEFESFRTVFRIDRLKGIITVNHGFSRMGL
jgi:hypothetical protein